MNVVFFHGLESPVVAGVPVGTKARFLRDRFGARTPAFDNRAAIAVVTRLAAGEPVSPAERADAFAGPLATARANLDGVDVAVGSSFGGALLVELLHERARAGLPNPAAMLELPAVGITAEERTLKGSYLGSGVPSRDIPRFLGLHAQGRLPVERLMSEKIRLEEINAGFDKLHAGQTIRQVIDFG